MALNGKLDTNAYETRYLRFSWTATQNIVANTSTVSWTLKGAGGDTMYYMSGPITLTIEGSTVYNSAARFRLYSGDTIASGTTTFTHLENGTKQFSVSIRAAIFTNAVNCTANGTFTLDMIARASQPSCITYPEHTQNVGKFGDTISIHMNRKSSAFTHRVIWEFGDQSGVCIDAETGKEATAVGTGFKWKIPKELMNQLPESLSGSGRIYVTTYNGSTSIGQKYCGFTATVSDDAYPSCSFVLDDVSLVDDIYGSPVKGLSKIKVTTTPTQAYNSPISSIKTVIDGITYTGSPITTGVLSKSGAVNVTTTVTDKRGRSGSKNYVMTVLDYASPAITALNVHRCDSDGTLNARGEYVKATFSASVSNPNSKNTNTYKLQYKKSSASTYTSVSLGSLGFSVTNSSKIFQAEGGSSWDVMVSVTDRHKTVSRSTSASTAFTLINYKESGTGIAFGKVSEKDNAFECALDMYDKWGYNIGNGKAAYGGAASPLDANTCLENVFLTNTNVPDAALWYVFQVFYNGKSAAGNRAQIAIPYEKDAPTHKRYKKGDTWSAWKTEEESDDSGWINATSALSSGFLSYTENDYPCYRKVGKVVNLAGTVKPSANITGNVEVQILTLPAGYRPSVPTYQLCQGSGNSIWLCALYTDGRVTFSRYRDFSLTDKYSYGTAGTTEWVKLHVTFLTT